jgi:hypothetical protein
MEASPMLAARFLRGSFIAIVAVLVTGCATVLGGGSNQAVSIRSDPVAATFSIRSSSGLQMASGQTPQQVTLARKNEYEIEFSMPGYHTQRTSLTKGLNGWVWLNLVAGGVVGGAIDVISGAAWKLEPSIVDIRLVKSPGGDGDVSVDIKMFNKNGLLIRELTIPMVPVER